MQTKQQIQQLLASVGTTPNKRLGQNFLIDMNLLSLLLKNAHLSNNDVVLEVGAGTGTLTEELVKFAGAVVAVEYDSALAKIVVSRVGGTENFKIFNADALENKNTINHDVTAELLKFKNQLGGRVLLVSNLPYNVASSVMMNMISGPIIADAMTVTIQKEVADRMAAEPGADDYSILSIFMGATGNVRLVRKLSPKVFWPQPQVHSAIVQFDWVEEKANRIHDMKTFRAVVNLFMGHRRKMVKACVKFASDELTRVHNWHDIFDRAVIDHHLRPEELTVENYIAIANLCYECLQ